MLKNIRTSRVSSIRRCYGQKPDTQYDAIIVGGGHNGLVAAAYLSKAGKKVCVLERRPIIGGAAVTEEIVKGFKFSRASYLLSLMRPQIYKDLNLKKFGLKYYLRNPSSYTPLRKPYWTSKAKSLTLSQDAAFNYAEISKFSQHDAEKYLQYEKKMENFVDCIQPLMDISPSSLARLFSKEVPLMTKLNLIKSKDMRDAISGLLKLSTCLPFAYEIMFTSAVDIMNKWFDSEPLKATIMTDACVGSTLSPETIGSSYVLIHHVMGGIDDHKGAWVYPEGGMGSVSKAIANCALHHGAHIFTNQNVVQIHLNDRNEVEGVSTEDGTFLKSSKILSNATPQVTFLNLLPSGSLDPKYANSIAKIKYQSPVTKFNVALNKIPNFLCDPNTSENAIMPHHRCTIHLNCESMDVILKAHEEGTNGILPNKPLIEMTLPSSLDPTLCPEGNHVCLIFSQYTMYNLKNGQSWDRQTKDEYAKLVFDSIEEYAPGFKESIVGYEILTPPDLEKIFGLTGGHIFHGELSLDQLFFNRPANWSTLSPYTAIKGLYLCGSGAHPGGGVTGSPGRLAALSAIDDFKNK
ncbi:pyridine nucleotide-disulfide oxidoreductase domain-containing protein 2-like [Planococcus citri]|uniref:pyridine nucleotide-disulfide oxidoreductase domain-containing protein 2-like n=1 Tax=Planococcus citri TaxID=170843 RepID=UPI0031F9D434